MDMVLHLYMDGLPILISKKKWEKIYLNLMKMKKNNPKHKLTMANLPFYNLFLLWHSLYYLQNLKMYTFLDEK